MPILQSNVKTSRRWPRESSHSIFDRQPRLGCALPILPADLSAARVLLDTVFDRCIPPLPFVAVEQAAGLSFFDEFVMVLRFARELQFLYVVHM
jgi:hypothetical protein